MRISDWSSDVCSSELTQQHLALPLIAIENALPVPLEQRPSVTPLIQIHCQSIPLPGYACPDTQCTQWQRRTAPAKLLARPSPASPPPSTHGRRRRYLPGARVPRYIAGDRKSVV